MKTHEQILLFLIDIMKKAAFRDVKIVLTIFL